MIRETALTLCKNIGTDIRLDRNSFELKYADYVVLQCEDSSFMFSRSSKL